MRGDDAPAVKDADVAFADQNLDPLLDEGVRNAVSDSVHVDEAVGRDAPAEATLARGRRSRRQRLERGRLLALEANARCLVRRAVLALIGFSHPRGQVRLKLGKRRERSTSDRVSLYVADAGLGLALGARAVRAAYSHRDVELAAELRKRWMEARDAGLAIATEDQWSGVVDQNCLR